MIPEKKRIRTLCPYRSMKIPFNGTRVATVRKGRLMKSPAICSFCSSENLSLDSLAVRYGAIPSVDDKGGFDHIEAQHSGIEKTSNS